MVFGLVQWHATALRWIFGAAVLILSLCSASGVRLEWDRNSEPNVAGYRIYWGTTSRGYSAVNDVGNLVTGEVTALLPGTTYYFAVTAYDTDGLESEFSDEVSYTVPQQNPNRPPSAGSDLFRVEQDSVLAIAAASGVLTNDTDLDGDALTAELTQTSQNGVLAFVANGAFIYTPAAGFVGVDSFRYRISDGKATSAVCVVTIVVQLKGGGGGGNTSPCSGCFADLDAVLASAGGGFQEVVRARNTSQTGSCLDDGLTIFYAVARAAAGIPDTALNSAIDAAATCLTYNVTNVAAQQAVAMESSPSSKFLDAARVKANTAAGLVQKAHSGSYVARGKSLLTAAANMKKVEQLLAVANTAPASLSNRVFSCSLAVGAEKVARKFAFNTSDFTATSIDGTPLPGGAYIWTRTGWNSGTLMLISSNGELIIMETVIAKTRGRVLGPEVTGTFTVE